ncbi:hypothetical protein [Poritiphilus flavus]|uniref:Lipocalin-like domain-containing protein n=1 Tax=Poritiphilus flavus TaxID=2697053 RepID=A0A6L9EHS6_9FLAO|nr:hypothetical protein [Poritiphilus flavus]NAS14334.1 hypothetical protein [Poritiphilus flavus]
MKLFKKEILKYMILPLFLLALGCNSEDEGESEAEQAEVSQLNSNLGVWEGSGMQPGISWTIKITLAENEQLIEYPSLDCGGFLTLLEEGDGVLLFRETITFNTVCADQGFVELIETSATTMDYNYYWPNASNEQGELGATGSVTKVD